MDTYTPMTVGSYWIYTQYETIPGIGEVSTGVVDSTFIASDTLINNVLYYVFRSSLTYGWLSVLRDSSGYLVNPLGARLFHDGNAGELLHERVSLNNMGDTIYYEKRIMEQAPNQIQVPAGSFEVMNAALYQYFPKAVNTPTQLKSNNYYAHNVGLIYRNYFSFGRALNFQLLRYHIAEE
jgi:hypothetical protein